MIDTLIVLAIYVVVIGIVLYLLHLLLSIIPMDATFRQIAWVLILLVAILVVLARALPLLGVSL